jgi:hypothetical protein
VDLQHSTNRKGYNDNVKQLGADIMQFIVSKESTYTFLQSDEVSSSSGANSDTDTHYASPNDISPPKRKAKASDDEEWIPNDTKKKKKKKMPSTHAHSKTRESAPNSSLHILFFQLFSTGFYIATTYAHYNLPLLSF